MNNDTPIQYGHVTATYFWDDGSGINGDTGLPASGEPMQKGLFSSPSWPLGTQGYVVYEGKKAEFFIGDRGPGAPSHDCGVLLDIDGKTFAELTGETWNDTSYTVSGGNGHIDVEYYITAWGEGNGTPGAPHPFQQPGNTCDNAVSPLPEPEPQDPAGQESAQAAGSPEEEQPADPEPDQGEREQREQDPSGAGEGAAQPPPAAQEHTAAPGHTAAQPAAVGSDGFRLTGSEVPLAGGVLVLALATALLLVLLIGRLRSLGAHAGPPAPGRTGRGPGRHRRTRPEGAPAPLRPLGGSA